ncbi:DUF6385 domain-containing protein [Pelotomaculum propionicicum]|uniref:DUF6385 domain-containing protein n=1 Tax=Pelotomaculum propionicicum TaxID=258475 RepID=A0A4Y7RKY8_9FIRM|nr:DUF6385 domain-containing protein [Pelotomaculum propionicicum]NLI13375.1 hypothetical protein [Peptococcaceae bacterium]TEB09523.1 hypothetical protein Pmgp_03068 [Pelotomaculum propionicicum]
MSGIADDNSSGLIIEDGGNLFYVCNPKKIRYKRQSFQCFCSDSEENLGTSDQERYSKTRDVSKFRTFTFLIKNEGLNSILCQVEISPEGVNWGAFGELEYTLSPGQMQPIVPQYFLHYARVKFKNKIPGFSSVIAIWFQGQR